MFEEKSAAAMGVTGIRISEGRGIIRKKKKFKKMGP
jgi:hypothetical protein